MIKVLTIIGARPQIIKAAAISRAIKNNFAEKLTEIIVHTGQHYDNNMSQVFFEEMNIPVPNYNLNVGSGSHGKQTAAMITGIENILEKEKPDAIILYGDTNSTLAGAIAASKIHIPIVHIEAGLRSHNKSMPEEINRIMCDHVSTLLFSPTKAGYNNLLSEGFKENNKSPFNFDNPKIYHCGDVMYDNSLYFSEQAEKKSTILKKNNLEKNNFILATIHRNNNTDDINRLNTLFKTLNFLSIQHTLDVVLPLHPRTSKMLEMNLSKELFDSIKNNLRFKIIPPASFMEMIVLEKHCRMVLTDSGGVQKEAFFFKKPCLILRSETEWTELVECGCAKICDADERKIIEAFNHYATQSMLEFPKIFGDGKAAEFICNEIITNIKPV